MSFFKSLGRNASIYIGITAPRPEHEQFFGILILISTVALTVGTVALVVVMTHMVLR